MFDFDDLFGSAATEGTRKMRILTGSLGAVAGGAIGAFSGSVLKGTTFAMVSNGAIGAVLGGFFAAMFSAFIIVILLTVIAFVCAIGWQIMTQGS